MSRNARVFALIAAILVTLPLLAGCSRGQAGITVAGSTSVQPFAEALAEEFMREQPGAVINVQGGGSSAGIQAALTGAAEIGMSSRELKKDEAAALKPVTIALDAIAIVVHPSNRLQDLSLEQVRSIFSAQARNWQAFGGPDKPIDIVTREEGSGTRGAFQELVMGKTDIYPGAIVQDSNGAVRQVVADDPNAIGYVSLGLVNNQVKAVSVDGVEPSVDAVKQKTYQLVRPFLYVVKGQPSTASDGFIQFTLGEKGQSMLATEGLVPAQ
ncbi:MAG: phosphate ABC transporter substrate-binding protein [Chloroflexota bacterium]